MNAQCVSEAVPLSYPEVCADAETTVISEVLGSSPVLVLGVALTLGVGLPLAVT